MTIVQGNNQSAMVNSLFGTALEVLVVDLFGVRVPNMNVTFSAPASGAQGLRRLLGRQPPGLPVPRADQRERRRDSFDRHGDVKSGSGYSVTKAASGAVAPSTFTEPNALGWGLPVLITPILGTATVSGTTMSRAVSNSRTIRQCRHEHRHHDADAQLQLDEGLLRHHHRVRRDPGRRRHGDLRQRRGDRHRVLRGRDGGDPDHHGQEGATTWGTTTVTINPGAPALVVITPTPGTATASATTNVKLGLQLVDQFGNATTSTGTTTLTLSSSSTKGFFATTTGSGGTRAPAPR